MSGDLATVTESDRVIAGFLTSVVRGLSDRAITEGLDDRTAAHLLTLVERDPSVRPLLAKAARYRKTSVPQKRTAASHVYFIQQGKAGPIKIGSASNPRGRLAALQTSNPERLYLLAAIEGGERAERAIHRALAGHRVRGEWFEADAVHQWLTTYREGAS